MYLQFLASWEKWLRCTLLIINTYADVCIVCVRPNIYMHHKITSCELRTSKNITRSCFLFCTFKKDFSGVSVSGLLLPELLGLVIGITIYNQGKIICLHVLIHGLLKKSNDSSRALHWDTSNNWLPRVGSTLMSMAHMMLFLVLFSWKSFRVRSGRVPSGPIFASNLHGRGHGLPARDSEVFSFSSSPWKTFTTDTRVCFKDKALWFTPLTRVAQSHLLFPLHCSSREQPLRWLQLT